MKLNEPKIVVFIAAVAIGILISLNINLSSTGGDRTILNTKEYQDASNLKNQVLSDVIRVKNNYFENEKKLDGYKNVENDKDKIVNEINQEINLNKEVLGYTSVKGPGLKMTLVDGTGEKFNNSITEQSNEYIRSRIIHDIDMIATVNELKNAGAEAISLNGQRIISNTDIYCSWAFLSVNGVKTPAPFYITAIGNKEVMKKYLLSSESYLKRLTNRGINVNIYEEDEVVIPAYIGEMENKNLNYQ